jgi:hypothetical protein
MTTALGEICSRAEDNSRRDVIVELIQNENVSGKKAANEGENIYKALHWIRTGQALTSHPVLSLTLTTPLPPTSYTQMLLSPCHRGVSSPRIPLTFMDYK